jgi:hypothetical protein
MIMMHKMGHTNFEDIANKIDRLLFREQGNSFVA